MVVGRRVLDMVIEVLECLFLGGGGGVLGVGVES